MLDARKLEPPRRVPVLRAWSGRPITADARRQVAGAATGQRHNSHPLALRSPQPPFSHLIKRHLASMERRTMAPCRCDVIIDVRSARVGVRPRSGRVTSRVSWRAREHTGARTRESSESVNRLSQSAPDAASSRLAFRRSASSRPC